jgi:hypothetical protein
VHVPGILKSRRKAIVDRWMDLTLQVYPEDSARFMRSEKDRFGNPVGRITRDALEAVFEGLLTDRTIEEMRGSLDEIVRLRAVQDLPPSRAVGFVFLLKSAIHAELDESEADRARSVDLTALDSGIDRLGLAAFDLFVQCREKIYDLRASEIRRRTASLLARAERGAAEETDEAQH